VEQLEEKTEKAQEMIGSEHCAHLVRLQRLSNEITELSSECERLDAQIAIVEGRTQMLLRQCPPGGKKREEERVRELIETEQKHAQFLREIKQKKKKPLARPPTQLEGRPKNHKKKPWGKRKRRQRIWMRKSIPTLDTRPTAPEEEEEQLSEREDGTDQGEQPSLDPDFIPGAIGTERSTFAQMMDQHEGSSQLRGDPDNEQVPSDRSFRCC
jgi:hypothetical protein